MYTNKQELIKQVNWALRLREPLCCGEVKDVRSKWTSEGYEVRFDGGSAMIAKKKNVPFFHANPPNDLIIYILSTSNFHANLLLLNNGVKVN